MHEITPKITHTHDEKMEIVQDKLLKAYPPPGPNAKKNKAKRKRKQLRKK